MSSLIYGWQILSQVSNRLGHTICNLPNIGRNFAYASIVADYDIFLSITYYKSFSIKITITYK
ncbi:MAG: hypothetical protein PUP91_31360, partial [Rhizonema sp. PD37]|nr:hypothetical protein [Rhizonema sp. PD37]